MRYSELTPKQKRRSDNVTCRKFDYKSNHIKAKDNPTGLKETREEFADRFWDQIRLGHSLNWYQKEQAQKATIDNSDFPDTNED
jgi:hypothetical protein